MAFDGSGNYVLPATTVTPAVADTVIDPTEFNTFTADLATALSLCLTEDGQNAATANLPMATNRHTGVGDATALTDYASANQVVDNTLHYGGASAVGTDAYAVNLPISPGAYVAGNRYQFIADVANTGACSINFSSVGVKSIKMQDGNDPVDNYILANSIVDVEYDGTNMVLMGLPSVGVNLASPQTLTNKTLTSPTIASATIASATITSPDIDQIVDSAGNEAVIFAEVASAVNELTVTNAASGNKPSINQTGTDDVGLDIEGVELHNGVITGSLIGSATSLTDLGGDIAGLTAGGIGTYAFATTASLATDVAFGATFSGASLSPTGLVTDVKPGLSTTLQSYAFNSSFSGTWRCMGYARDITANFAITLWLRIS